MSFAQRVFIGVIIAAVICIGTVYYSQQQLTTLTASLQDHSRSERIVAASEKLLGQFISMETSARSFLITGMEQDLQPFSKNVGEVSLSLRELRAACQPAEEERASALNFLDAALDKKITETNYAIILRREQGIKISAFELIKYKNLNIADTITQVMRRIASTEIAQQKERIQSIPTQYYALAPPMLIGISAAAFVIILFGMWASLAQHSALKPIIKGAEKLALGEVRHRIPPNTGGSDIKPIITALNSLGEQLLLRQGTERRTENIFADIVHASTEPIAVWRACRNGLGQISDFECLFANGAFGKLYQYPAEALSGSLLSHARFSDLHSTKEAFIHVVEQQQILNIPHLSNSTTLRLIATKMRDGFLLRLPE